MNITDYFNPYGYAMKLRRFLYKEGILRSVNVSVPVISIGNLSTGGTGKTPVTLFIAKYIIKNLNKRVAIVLRGYKRKSRGLLIVSDGISVKEDVMKSGDEAQLYAQEFPGAIVLCDEDRVRGSQKAIQLGADAILLDDAFQHLRIKRDLNILLFDASGGIPPVMPFGKGRESESAAKDADIIVMTNSSKHNSANERRTDIRTEINITSLDIYTAHGRTNEVVQILNEKNILALSAIGNPKYFENYLSQYAGHLISYRLPDHSEYNDALIEKIILKAKETACDYIVTTTKDAVKMLDIYKIILSRKNDNIPALVVAHAELKFLTGEEILFSKINDLFQIQ